MVFRVGVGKKIGGINFFLSKSVSGSSSKVKKLSAKDLKDKEFNDFLRKCESDTNYAIMDFFRLNGYDPARLQRERIDLDDLFEGDESFEVFSELVLCAKEEMEKAMYSGDTGIQAKRDISEKIFELKGFISRYKARDHENSKYPFLKQPEVINSQAIFSKPSISFIDRVKGIFNSNSTLFVSNKESDVQPSTARQILLVFLWVGIFFMPYIFSWFTLSKGFGKKSKIIAFVWLFVVVLLLISNPQSSSGT